MSTQSKRLYEFGPFRLDTSERLLLRNDRIVTLTPKAFDTLVALIENTGRLVERDDLMRAVWPDTFVDESTLTSNISILRKALGQNNGDQYIETVPKRGYRFVADVKELHLEAGDLIVRKRARSRLMIREETETRHGDEWTGRWSERHIFNRTAVILIALLALAAVAVLTYLFISRRDARNFVAADRAQLSKSTRWLCFHSSLLELKAMTSTSDWA